MSKVTATVEAHVCDGCGAQTYVTPCLHCDVEHCWECRKKLGREYAHAVYFAGSGDGYYCKSCDGELSRNGSDPLHNAYVEIQQVRDDRIAADRRFKELGDKAEANLKALQS